jgi:MoaA/NifB/PqqE/SkfB family radical SAM enzyme
MVEISSPFVVNIDLTNRCNLRCSYCYAATREAIDIPTEKCIQLIEELVDIYGVFHITLAGGEPLFHPGILQIINESVSRFGDRIALLSNGTRLLDDLFFEEFSKVCWDLHHGGQPLDMQISLDSFLPEIHDKQRDQGQKVIESIERALTLPITLQLACVVTKHNVHCADEIIDAFYPRIKNFHYMNIMPSKGRSAGCNYWDILPSKQQIQEFHQRILERERIYHPVRITKIVREGNKEGGSLCVPGCLAATTRIDIAPDLKVFACCMSDEMLGSLSEQTFEEMWLSAKAEDVRSMEMPYCFKWAETSPHGKPL